MYNPKYAKFIGVPFVDGGRDEKGCDCWGLVCAIFKMNGILLPDYTISCFDTKPVIEAMKAAEGKWQRLEQPTEPCLVAMCLAPEYPRMVNHVGVYVGDGWYLHTIAKTNSCVMKIDNPVYKKRIQGFYTWKG